MSFEPAILRILDANANRAREALRVMEDVARFALNDAGTMEILKGIRHDLAAALAQLPMTAALGARNTPGDVGTVVKTAAELQRADLRAVVTANGKRLSEALRSMEEAAKVIAPAAAALLEKLRYRGYVAEQAMAAAMARRAGSTRFSAVRLYVLLTETLCGPVGKVVRWEEVLEQILSATPRVAGEVFPVAVQLREKVLTDGELLRRARVVVQMCGKAGALAIINDRVDIALLAEADGVHLGQTDISCADARKVLGPEAVIGISTERLEEAQAAVESTVASYVAVGPMFPTTTKEKPRIAGPTYAAAAAAEIGERAPLVAIGGITLENVRQVMAAGVRRVAVSSAVLRAPDIGAMVRGFLAALQPATE